MMTQSAAPPAPAAPQGRSELSRSELLTLVSALMGLMALAIDLMLPAFDDIRAAYDLGEGSTEAARVVTVFFLGLAVAQLVYGPLADRYGRKPILYTGIGIYMIGALGSALAPTFNLLLLSRFVWGIGAAGSRVVATAIIRDRFEGTEMAKAMSRIMAVFVLVPVLAPAVGSVIIAVFPWRGVFWFCLVWAVLISLWSTRLGETLDPAHRRSLNLVEISRSYVRVARTPITSGYTNATIFLQGVFTAYLASSEIIISDIFDREDQFPFVFGGVALMFGAGAILNGRLLNVIGVERLITRTYIVQLPLTAVLIAVSVSADGSPNFWVFMPLLGAILATFMFLMPNLNASAMGPVGDLAGTASAYAGAVRMAAGAVLGTVISNATSTSVTPFAVGVGALCSMGALSVWRVRQRAHQRGEPIIN
jgi:DHA1 family bicyclomycin/chloramphenicol resistance-like MFS transporter